MRIAVLLVLAASPFAGKYRDAVQCISDRKYGEATALLNEIAAVEPRWAEVFAARCSAQLGLKRPDSAAADCRYALQLKPGLVVALYGLATAERGLGQTHEAAAHFRQYAASASPDATPELKAAAAQAAAQLEPEQGWKVGPSSPPPPAPAQPVTGSATADSWVAFGAAVHANEARRPSAGAAPDACNSDIDCHRGWCKDRGDGVRVCMDRGGNGDFCQSSIDCGRGFCKDRGDGMKVCMDRGSSGSFCESTIDCGGGLWCKDRGDGVKACMR